MAGKTARVALPPPPDELDEAAAAVWTELVSAHPKPASIVGPDLEAFCGQVALVRDCRARVAEEGAIVAGTKNEPIPHPALAIAKAAQEFVTKHAARFAPPQPLRRRSGTVYDATKASIAAAKHLTPVEYSGACAAVLTLAWMIDEAQRLGYAALEKAAFGTIPSYLKGCDALRITPASLPIAVPTAPPAPIAGDDPPPSGVTSLQEKAAERRRRGAG